MEKFSPEDESFINDLSPTSDDHEEIGREMLHSLSSETLSNMPTRQRYTISKGEAVVPHISSAPVISDYERKKEQEGVEIKRRNLNLKRVGACIEFNF
jgi:hypothetical protein